MSELEVCRKERRRNLGQTFLSISLSSCSSARLDVESSMRSAAQTSSLSLLLIYQFTFWLRSGIIDAVLALFIRRMGISVTDIGFLMVIQSLGWAIFEPIFGFVTDKIGKKRLMLYSAVSTSLVYFSYPLANSIWHFRFIVFALSSNMAAGLVSTRALTGRASTSFSKSRSLREIHGNSISRTHNRPLSWWIPRRQY